MQSPCCQGKKESHETFKKLDGSWHERYPRLQVLYMSGYANNAIIKNDKLASGFPFIQKPFTAEDLVVTILKALGEKHHD
jgi:DNA-binding NtrC family response regulator